MTLRNLFAASVILLHAARSAQTHKAKRNLGLRGR